MQAGTRTERGDRTRARILDAAAQVFAEDGYEGASMARILATAGATKGGFYFHFASKEELAIAVLAAQQQDWFTETMAEVAVHERAVDRLFAVPFVLLRQIHEGRGFVSMHRLVADLCALEHLAVHMQSGLDPWIAAVTTQFEEAVAEGSLRADLDPRLMAELVIGAFSGLATLTDQLNDDRLDERVDALVTTVRAATERPATGRPATGRPATERQAGRPAARKRVVTGKGRRP
jgi:AcrR family transcriptional regulator